MMKKMIVTTVLAAGFLSIAPHAMAISDHSGTTSLSGNGAKQAFGNSKAEGDMSPQLSLAQGSLDKPCIALPVKANIGSLVGLINVAVQDIPILSAPQNQQCTENSTQAKGDEPLSHILNDIPVLSGNGEFNG
ncbi:rodlin [Streptomyces viridochromogenes]|uniref:rodlin n=1 Tax=Streptomyces viridochromogenes TaxID=1938 RepID=UPI00069D9CF4|nr:rodlin [Streptomyces viridochromogenes]KOG07333.1 RdlA protein [Streptomyces viridochromogenes]KOG12860.1 RdlA protein [Streptomyces viridochromogenes]